MFRTGLGRKLVLTFVILILFAQFISITYIPIFTARAILLKREKQSFLHGKNPSNIRHKSHSRRRYTLFSHIPCLHTLVTLGRLGSEEHLQDVCWRFYDE